MKTITKVGIKSFYTSKVDFTPVSTKSNLCSNYKIPLKLKKKIDYNNFPTAKITMEPKNFK